MTDAAPHLLTLADLRGLWRLGIDASLGLTDLVEQLHATIQAGRAPLGRPHRDSAAGLSGLVYRGVRGSMRLVGHGVDGALRWAQPAAAATTARRPHAEREALRAVLNGLWGDHLAASHNPLAIPMALRVAGHALTLSRTALARDLPDARRRVAVLVHGLCMNDLQWQRQPAPGTPWHHGRLLAEALGCTVLALHHNSGRHISHNGAELAGLLQQLATHWPVPLDELLLVGHSQGGLLARSAVWQAEQQGLGWRRQLAALVCLGTPHHGALLERGGHWVDTLLQVSPYAAPFARLGLARSAGITDLRWGNLRDEDWQPEDAGTADPGSAAGDARPADSAGLRPDGGRDRRRPTPLPAGVPVYLLAATTVAQPRGLRHALVGDGLVTVASAWGEHPDPARRLAVPAAHKRLITQANHWDLLSRPEAAQALRDWLA